MKAREEYSVNPLGTFVGKDRKKPAPRTRKERPKPLRRGKNPFAR